MVCFLGLYSLQTSEMPAIPKELIQTGSSSLASKTGFHQKPSGFVPKEYGSENIINLWFLCGLAGRADCECNTSFSKMM